METLKYQISAAELEVLRAYAFSHNHYRSINVVRGLKSRGLLQWMNQDFSTGALEISGKGREALNERDVVA